VSLLFLNGLMPERHGGFLRALGRHHTLTGTCVPALAGEPGLQLIDYLDDRRLPSLLADLVPRVAAGTRELAASLAIELAATQTDAGLAAAPDEREIAELVRPRVFRLVQEELRFRAFVAEHPVDMVLSGSDFSSHSRVIARTARRLGIPTLDIEHGFFFNRLTGDWCRVHGRMPLLFTSEHVNLDNALEKELFEYEQTLFPRHDPAEEVSFLALGTPIDTVATQEMPREQALAALGLDPARPQVLLGGSWIEARTVNMLLGAQVDAMDLYEELFASLAAREFGRRAQLTIKLHPADCRGDVLPGVQAAYTQLARRHGLPAPLILSDSLAEAMSACDVLVTPSFSSILYDAFLMGKPSVIVFPRYLRFGEGEAWLRESTLPLRAGVCEATADGDDAWRRVEAWLEPERRARFARDHAAFSRRYGLGDRPVAEKSAAILDWIEQRLAVRAG
jgi:hypothetical protein